jgi:hypothetical protein
MVYIIAPPVTRSAPEWPAVLADLTRRIKGCRFAEFSAVFKSNADYRARWPQVAATLAGAVVIPRLTGGRLMLGMAAVREASDVADLGGTVLVHASGRGLFPWSQAEVKIHGKDAGRFRAELVITGDVR